MIKIEKPFFSILVPVFNVEKYLSRCLSSIINQPFENIEIICVDDGSTDNSLKILKEYEKFDKRIKAVKHKRNLSPLVARQTAVKHAYGNYIMFIDSDDYYSENAFKLIYERLSGNPVDILEYGMCRQPENDILISEKSSRQEDRVKALLKEKSSYYQTLCNKAYDVKIIKTAFSKMNQFYANMAEDCYQSIIIANNAKTFDYLDIPLYNYYSNSGITSNQKRPLEWAKSIIESYKLVLINIKEYFEKNAIQYLNDLKGLEAHLIRDAIFNFIKPNLNEDDMINILMVLPNYFDPKLIAVHLKSLISNEQKYKNLYKNTLEYKTINLFTRVKNKLRKFRNSRN